MSPHMYPESLMGVDVKSSAERTVFEAFQSQLDDDFYILHSVSWIEIRRKGKKPSDGEIDFVILAGIRTTCGIPFVRMEPVLI